VELVILTEGALAPTEALWQAAVEHLAQKLGRVTPLDAADVPADRPGAIAYLDAWAGDDASRWRLELRRFADDHVPVYVRPDPDRNAAVRALAARGVRVACWSPGPAELTEPLLHHLGLARRVEPLVCDSGPDALANLLAGLDVPAAEAVLVGASMPHEAAQAAGCGIPVEPGERLVELAAANAA
jgi:phosphoglycolate phosphatase-like HAD superfamily hydrolase